MTKHPIPNPQYPIPDTKHQIRHWTLIVTLLLLAWGLRLCCLETVPPGWRDDELINIHALSGEVLAGHFPLYFTGASGHEPLYHCVHAGVHALLGFNVLSGHLLSVACGTLAVALTYGLAWRLFGRTTAIVASLALATSFWSLMYSRTGMRHISATPFALAPSIPTPLRACCRWCWSCLPSTWRCCTGINPPVIGVAFSWRSRSRLC